MPRPLLTGCAAMAIAASALVLAGLAVPRGAADAATAQPPGGAPLVTLAITSVSPSFATPGQTVTVSGTLTNASTTALPGLSVQLRSGSSRFTSRNILQEYADGDPFNDQPVPGAVTDLTGSLAPRATATWSVALHVNQVPMTMFGVYPLAAQADDSSGNPLAVNRTYLPFWPGTKALDPQLQQIAWVWPLIDQPRQGLCSDGLLNNGLAASVASGGRLSGLLQVGTQYTNSAHLTWAIDPALLSNLATMTKPYYAGGVGCPGSQRSGRAAAAKRAASAAAASWLTQLKSVTASQPVFVTPYADADIAALTKDDLNSDLSRAFTTGRSVAGQILGRDLSPAAQNSLNLNGMAWPADGIANYGVLENLAASDKISTVVLDTTTMPPSPQQDFTPSAQTSTPDGEGAALNVLLSDDTITQIIGSANSASTSKATAFSVEQRYLAETAMIAAEQPNLRRSIVVAPPRRWDPPAGLAGRLLAETVDAPWLRPVSLDQLATDKHPSGQVSRQAPASTSKAELGRSLLGAARQLDQQVGLLQSIQVPASSDRAIENGVAAVESSAWRGGGRAGRQGAALAQELSAYLSGQEGELNIIGPAQITLAGLKGPVPVSISNGLPYAVQVRLAVDPSGGVKVQAQSPIMIVPAGQQVIKKVEVAATTVGSTTLTLHLLTPKGAPLPAQTVVIIQATHYGSLALVIIAGALGILVLTLGTRAFRRARRKTQERSSGSLTDEMPPPEGPQDGEAAKHDWPDAPGEADTVVTDRFTVGHDAAHASDHDPAEETDDYAWAPGRADPR
jgi:hypothetical protein